MDGTTRSGNGTTRSRFLGSGANMVYGTLFAEDKTAPKERSYPMVYHIPYHEFPKIVVFQSYPPLYSYHHNLHSHPILVGPSSFSCVKS